VNGIDWLTVLCAGKAEAPQEEQEEQGSTMSNARRKHYAIYETSAWFIDGCEYV
jgi:hypothetical protein